MIEIINKKLILEKYPGKGGWIFVLLENLPKFKKGKSNWVTVSGRIDSYEVENVKLWPMGNGKSFMPVKADIRKIIKKNEGDEVQVVLYGEAPTPDITKSDFILCLDDEPLAKKYFNYLSQKEKDLYINWIFSINDEETKIDRMGKSINALSKNKKFNLK